MRRRGSLYIFCAWINVIAMQIIIAAALNDHIVDHFKTAYIPGTLAIFFVLLAIYEEVKQ